MRVTTRHIVLLIIIVIFGMIFFSYVGSLYRQYQREEYKADLAEEIKKLDEDKSKLEKLLEYVRTDEYRELKAKENLGQKVAGETVVVIPPTMDLSGSKQAENKVPISERPILEQWLVYFFGDK
ncbi:MAG: septum formation initiator family protein [Patescibacteria group bacterium]|nr:septum formation initiator family protein [Patescibacteria group bacterium]